MMIDKRKIPVILILFSLFVLFAACGKDETVTERTTSDYVYHSSVITITEPAENAVSGELTEEYITAAGTTDAETAASSVYDPSLSVTEPYTVYQSEPTAAVSTEAYTSVPAATESPTVPPATSPVSTAYQGTTEVDLSITMPEANGKMKVYKSPSNKYIEAVSSVKGIDASRLCAVVSVPETGQNYVFEFLSDNARGVNDLKKVYLLDGNCNILNVAAADSSQKVNLSTTENWFCMNVLIKGVIYPAIKDQF